MNSQPTLVDARDPPSEENIILVFDRDDMKNTTLRIRDIHRPSYSVVTRNNITTICAGECLLATVTRRKFLLDQIMFPELKPMKLGSWLKAPLLLSFPLKFRACGRRFRWQEDHSGRLVLYESGRRRNDLAWFSKNRGDLGNPAGAVYLSIKPEMAEMRDIIVLSCVLAEHKRRVVSARQGVTILDTMVLGF